jgi:Cu2+-exporting ATPase
LGKAEWCGTDTDSNDASMEMWFRQGDSPPVRFVFADQLRADAPQVVQNLWNQGFRILLLSGDRKNVTEKIANELNIKDYKAALSPVEKSAIMQDLIAQGQTVLMVGDGLNDAPALAGASVSMSPSSAMDITQNAADIVFQGQNLAPVTDAIRIAKTTRRLVNQNFAMSFAYNIIAIPVAVMGQVTPLLAAILMSASSILVVLNALRLGFIKK